ncbi:hypothetical protein HMPREF1988_01405 [Porphyromonas gingivalis F0185]|nr:hypothetical protein HMPREF1553_02301 [Porphyromonas gingivalis F0568]ERJ82671.1 hypothetical protein HMPREF1988_01405 [Porphyromonas gingivalis F0185]
MSDLYRTSLNTERPSATGFGAEADGRRSEKRGINLYINR